MTLSPHIESLLRDLRQRLEALYGDRLHAVVLYGSQARGKATEASDVDVMVVLEGDVDVWTEIRRMGESVYQVGSQYEELVSILPVSKTEFEEPQEDIMWNAREEGIVA